MLQASRRGGGCWDSDVRHVRKCAGTGMAPDRYGDLACSEVKCAGLAPWRQVFQEIQQVIAVQKIERIFSMSENTHFSASDKLFKRRCGKAFHYSGYNHLLDMLYVGKQCDNTLFNFSDLA